MRAATITVKTQFEGLHRWPDAPLITSFLQVEHRHVFVVRATVKVSHHNRQVEFFALKQDIDSFVRRAYTYNLGERSCEMIANEIIDELETFHYQVESVSVFEDDENGATVHAE